MMLGSATRDPHKTPPDDLDQRTNEYMQKAKHLGIDERRVRRYARILIAAEEVVAYRPVRERNTRDLMALVGAAEHGKILTDAQQARKEYAAARQLQQELHNSAKAYVDKLSRFQRILERCYATLNVGVAEKFGLRDIRAACELLKEFAAATALRGENVSDFKMARSELSLSKAGHTYLWWRVYITKYRGRLNDMYALARCWRLSDANDIDHFKRYTLKFRPKQIAQGVKTFLACPPWALL